MVYPNPKRISREGEAPAEPRARQRSKLATLRRAPIWSPIVFNTTSTHKRLGRSLALPKRDRLKDELFQVLEGSTR